MTTIFHFTAFHSVISIIYCLMMGDKRFKIGKTKIFGTFLLHGLIFEFIQKM